MIRVSYIIPHAWWAGDARRACVERMCEQLEHAGAYGIVVLRHHFREHASVWSRRAWDRAAASGSHTVILNDDVVLPPEFHRVILAMIEAVPEQCLSLHATAPAVAQYASSTPWVRSYHYTGPAMVLPPGVPDELLGFASRMPWSWVSRVNEDELAAQWAWSRQRPFWLAVPSPVVHDVSIASTLGYDAQTERATSVPWTGDEDLTDPERWRPRGDPPHVDCSWNPPARLARLHQLLEHASVCVMCRAREGVVGMGDTKICRHCTEKCGEMIR